MSPLRDTNVRDISVDTAELKLAATSLRPVTCQ